MVLSLFERLELSLQISEVCFNFPSDGWKYQNIGLHQDVCKVLPYFCSRSFVRNIHLPHQLCLSVSSRLFSVSCWTACEAMSNTSVKSKMFMSPWLMRRSSELENSVLLEELWFFIYDYFVNRTNRLEIISCCSETQASVTLVETFKKKKITFFPLLM